ncbi:Cytochrome b5-like heme/steroid binding domain [Macleaya cordata]|uniref:Cytochrome b5-like heme/steroid binding domain n=1 Tax=Macleaya cordata TaxID=56857 RepID=A0A200PRK5_MACCD|nr:Cytochrome b5-like heme/steroid binding domain [Macleaya cordata]
MPTLTKLFTWQEASEHKTRDDCWVIVDGKVYDVTDYLDEHPGGDDVLLKAAGRDATDEFEDAGHSKSAIELMKSYCIGEVDPTSPLIPELKISTEKPKPSFTNKLKDITSQYWAIPVAIVGIAVVAGMLYSRKK